MNTQSTSPYSSFKAHASIVNNRYGTSWCVGPMHSATPGKKPPNAAPLVEADRETYGMTKSTFTQNSFDVRSHEAHE